ncbi:MAG: carbohydrate ABC transporter permease [Firmicutes bacterium]|nr:carbohydrate ABC transporter permease [Bacillota bacterium]
MKPRYHWFKEIGINLLLVLISLFFAFPILWLVLMSIKQPQDTFKLPPVLWFSPTLESYKQLLFRSHYSIGLDFWRLFRNSAISAMVAAALSMFVASLGAYSLSRFYFRGKKLLSFIIIATRMLPPLASAIPLFLFAFRLGMIDTLFILSTVYCVINIPFALWMLRGFMDQVPTELEESAMIDGCTRFGAMLRIVMPLIGPGLGATAIFTFLNSWNDFALALVLTNKNAMTLPLVAMSFITEEGVYWGPMSAAITLIAAPAVLFVIVAQGYLAKGLTMGAVKG